ncbi:hypothetical protein [uncultured Tenacibaculum sp.]|uniref:hypothetical protein n=1 Tax=uncultured Tenacibaculum sp. TaxID=174713 RepID=UPI00261742D5|nr:hypothetical protein [uncultured Tenacibaculum sp.]
MGKSIIQKELLYNQTGGLKPTKDMICAQFEGWGPAPTNGMNGFFDGLNLKDLISTAGTTWAQIEQARNGQPVYVQGSNGQQQNIAPLLVSKLEAQAKQQQTSVDNMIKMLQMQMQAQAENNKPKDNTLKYIAIGAGVLVLFGGVYLITRKK